MFTFINASVIFAFGLVITGIVVLGIMQAREQAEREAVVDEANDSDEPSSLRRLG